MPQQGLSLCGWSGVLPGDKSRLGLKSRTMCGYIKPYHSQSLCWCPWFLSSSRIIWISRIWAPTFGYIVAWESPWSWGVADLKRLLCHLGPWYSYIVCLFCFVVNNFWGWVSCEKMLQGDGRIWRNCEVSGIGVLMWNSQIINKELCYERKKGT